MTHVLDQIIDALRDGKTHNIKEVASQTNLNDKQLTLALSFLRRFRFIKVEWYKGECSLTQSTINFLNFLRELEAYESCGCKP